MLGGSAFLRPTPGHPSPGLLAQVIWFDHDGRLDISRLAAIVRHRIRIETEEVRRLKASVILPANAND